MHEARGLARLFAGAVVALVACRSEPPAARLVVFAAASLREAFTALGEDFERTHPGTKVTFNFAGTQELRTQLEHGAEADVFAAADPLQMDELVRMSRASAPVVFARNEPVIVVAAEAAARIRGIADLPSASRVVIGTPEAPIGRYALQILDSAGATLGEGFRDRVEAKVVSRESNVRQVLMKVSLGEAEAGFVYRSDAQSATARVTVVDIPPELGVVAEYPIAVVTGSAKPALARDWIDFVLSTHGQDALRRAGLLGSAGSRPTP